MTSTAQKSSVSPSLSRSLSCCSDGGFEREVEFPEVPKSRNRESEAGRARTDMPLSQPHRVVASCLSVLHHPHNTAGKGRLQTSSDVFILWHHTRNHLFASHAIPRCAVARRLRSGLLAVSVHTFLRPGGRALPASFLLLIFRAALFLRTRPVSRRNPQPRALVLRFNTLLFRSHTLYRVAQCCSLSSRTRLPLCAAAFLLPLLAMVPLSCSTCRTPVRPCLSTGGSDRARPRAF